MKEILLHTFKDTIKLLPFLFITFLIMEYIEHKFSNKSKDKIVKSGKFGLIIGSLLGAIPQCGFSVMATNLYATRIISVGTLVSIYLSTSDEMLPILISNGKDINIILKILLIKICIGMICGFLIDFVLRKKRNNNNIEIKDFCSEEHCDCDHGILKSSLKHTFSVFLFIIIVTFILNFGIHTLGEENIRTLFLKDSFFSPFLSSLIGLIPNCASSVILTELYLSEMITLSSCISGLLTGSGVALIVLFKVNKSQKDNIRIIIMLYLIGVISGIFMNILQMLF